MSPAEIEVIKALRAVTFPPATGAKRLVRDLYAVIEFGHGEEYPLSARQRQAIASIAHRFRRQIPSGVVAIAESLKVAS